MDTQDQTSFGVFKPVGHVLLSFASGKQAAAARQALIDDGLAAADLQALDDRQMLAQTDRDLSRASGIATVGQELNLVRAHRALASRGYHFLVVKAAEDAQAVRVADTARAHGAERAQLYGNFIIEELIDHPEDLPPVNETPESGLDAQTPSGEEIERHHLRPAPPPGPDDER